MKITSKKAVIRVPLICIILGVGVFGYLEIFTKGLDRLPAKVCDGAVDRETAADALPDTRKALERGKMLTTGNGFMFACYVKVSSQDSIISGESKTADASEATWRDGAKGDGDGKEIKMSSGNVEIISWRDQTEVYILCVPPGKEKEKALQSYSLITQARTTGETRAKGDQLRQTITDFAYQTARHAYKAGGCQERQEFPDELPRLASE